MSDTNEIAFDPHQWNIEIAGVLAESVGLYELDAAGITVLEYLREHYLTHGSILTEEEVCHARGLEKHCIRGLFGDYEKAWKTASLPNPGMQLREFMEDAG